MRGRGGGGGRKGQNQLNRSMESSGPDVKIRGTAAHIAEKYMALARDAISSGDMIAAENYHQHAEHYNRMIAAAVAAQAQRNEQRQQEAAERENRNSGDAEAANGQASDQSKNEGEATAPSSASDGDVSAVNGSGPQPVLDEVPAEVSIKDTPVNGAAPKAEAEAEGEPKPKRTRRPRRPKREATDAPAEQAASDNASELPAFIVGE
ncbi:MAG: DUF4167 domain-containing protein [Pseudomonadota bacterium]